jgi:hypothetical protein
MVNGLSSSVASTCFPSSRITLIPSLSRCRQHSVTPAAKVIFGLTNFDGWLNKQYTDNRHEVQSMADLDLIKQQET